VGSWRLRDHGRRGCGVMAAARPRTMAWPWAVRERRGNGTAAAAWEDGGGAEKRWQRGGEQRRGGEVAGRRRRCGGEQWRIEKKI
jgi:hypothetical protein